jgi:hypothetical protein
MAHMEVPTVTDKVLFLEMNVVNFEERRKQEGLTSIAPKCQRKSVKRVFSYILYPKYQI